MSSLRERIVAAHNDLKQPEPPPEVVAPIVPRVAAALVPHVVLPDDILVPSPALPPPAPRKSLPPDVHASVHQRVVKA